MIFGNASPLTFPKPAFWEDALQAKSADDYEMLLMQLGAATARLEPKHFLSSLYAQQKQPDFATSLDNTLLDIACDLMHGFDWDKRTTVNLPVASR